jgi:hypothetical protein
LEVTDDVGKVRCVAFLKTQQIHLVVPHEGFEFPAGFVLTKVVADCADQSALL